MLKKTTFAQTLGLAPAGDPQLRFLGEAGYRWLELGHPGVAAAVFEGLSYLAPNSPAGSLGWAEALLAQGMLPDAERRARAAVRCEHADRRTLAYCYVVLGRALRRQGKDSAADAACLTAADLETGCPGAVSVESTGALSSYNIEPPTCSQVLQNLSSSQETSDGSRR